jgi:hypothetical protein
MLSARLLERIDRNWEEIASQVISHTRRDARLSQYHSLSDAEIRERARDLARNLRRWLEGLSDAELAATYAALGRRRCVGGVPLQEVVLKIQLIKRKFAAYAMEQNLALTPVEIYQELELLRALGRFFDIVIQGVVEGYENELRRNEADNLRQCLA